MKLTNILGLLALALFVAAPAAAKKKKTIAVIKTNMGVIEAELYPDKAPISVKNFTQYAKDKFYDGTIFHRVISNFMIQGGGFTKDLVKKTTRDPIKNEAKNGLLNERGTLAMARTMVVDSATSQFFINLKHNKFLDHGARDFGYAVFGKVIKGMEVIDKIAQLKTGPKGPFRSDCPQKEVIIESIAIK